MQNQSNLAMEVIIVFSVWLTSRRGTLKVGEDFSPKELMNLTQEFIDWNDFGQGFNGDVSMPPSLWFRFTPKLGKIEWKVRKLLKHLFS